MDGLDHQLLEIYRRFGVTLTRGDGAECWDSEGRHYWDFLAGIGVASLGYNHPAVRQALLDSASLLHTSNLFWHEPGMELSRKMSAVTGGYRSLWVNSGTEANEAGIKFIRRYGLETGRRNILSFSGGFHGRTMGALSATPVSAYQDPFAPLVPGFFAVPYGDLEALDEALDRYQPAGVLMEAIQGESGVVVPPPGYLEAAGRRIQAAGALLLMDEVQAGMGRTGQWFAFQAEAVRPDLITVAKGLGSGVPIGGLLVRPGLEDILQPGDHGSTFGGNPLASRVALAVVDWLEHGGLDHVRAVSGDLEQALADLARRYPQFITGLRGRGLMRGIALECDSPSLVARALAHGLIVNAPRPRVMRLLPPLVIDSRAVAAFHEIMGVLFEQMAAVGSGING